MEIIAFQEPLTCFLVEEKLDIHPSILGIDGGIVVADGAAVLDRLGLHQLLDDAGTLRLPKIVAYLVLPILIIPRRMHLKCLLWMDWSSSAQGNQLSTSR